MGCGFDPHTKVSKVRILPPVFGHLLALGVRARERRPVGRHKVEAADRPYNGEIKWNGISLKILFVLITQADG